MFPSYISDLSAIAGVDSPNGMSKGVEGCLKAVQKWSPVSVCEFPLKNQTTRVVIEKKMDENMQCQSTTGTWGFPFSIRPRGG